MEYNEKLLCSLKEKYSFEEISANYDGFILFSFGAKKNNNYFILKDDICGGDELHKVTEFIDSLSKTQFSNATFIFVAFVKSDFPNGDYMLFNGTSFLHTISYNLITSQYVYDKNFSYLGSIRIKELFSDIEKVIF